MDIRRKASFAFFGLMGYWLPMAVAIGIVALLIVLLWQD